jgi:pyruvate-ferredoxin/flavodoxin oxidoreductase
MYCNRQRFKLLPAVIVTAAEEIRCTVDRAKPITIDGNEAAALIAYKTNEVIAIYPITPSTNMGESCDAYASAGKTNIWGDVPLIREMQSEGGAAGAVHGALQTGCLSTTFTASQGLLLMIPNMYKIAGELTSTVFHVTARALATHALSIFGDHSDVMSTRSCGWAMLFSASVQEVMDMALIAQASTLAARVPFIHAFDGFRTSHEIQKIEPISDDQIRQMVRQELVAAHHGRGLSPEHPVLRGTAQNPDVFFQGREASNQYYDATPEIVQNEMDRLAALTGRQYRLFDYVGASDAERVIISMGSSVETLEDTVETLNSAGEKVGLLKVRLFRPFSAAKLIAALPATVKRIAVLDRCKEPGSAGEPLYQDVVTAVVETVSAGEAPFSQMPLVIGGRYGLGSKEFTPAMAKGVFDNLALPKPKAHFTIGINDDITNTSLPFDPSFSTESSATVRAVFWGLGSDGTVGANKNSVKIIGEETDNFAQGYFVYDSKKSGSITTSHLRFGPDPIRRPYLIESAQFVGVHQFGFLERYPVLDVAAKNATVLIDSPYGIDEVWAKIPLAIRKQIIAKNLKLYIINAAKVARESGMGNRINTIMQTAFFALSGVLPRDEAIEQIKKAIKKTYLKRGQSVVDKNNAAVDATLAHLFELPIPATIDANEVAGAALEFCPSDAPEFVRTVTAEIAAGRGDALAVSAMPADGTWPTATALYEKRNIAAFIPIWENDVCIQCGKCVLVCPHAVIRAKTLTAEQAAAAPATFKTSDAKWKEFPGQKYTLQISTEDCTGCNLCVDVCPAKDKTQVSRKAINMVEHGEALPEDQENWKYFVNLPEAPRDGTLKYTNIKNVQLLQPLFEFSGACAGCGETPYVKLLSQLFGDRAIIANATGCSSIYGGNLPTTPWTVTAAGRGPAWSNSLFEDNAEFGMGMRMTVDHQTLYAKRLVNELRGRIGDGLADSLLSDELGTDAVIKARREQIVELRSKLASATDNVARDLIRIADNLVPRSIWILGGDGWAYDIGYGGVDHVLASGENVNVLVLDTEVYSNTGGQMSKSTPRGAVAKFAAKGKLMAKKDLGKIAISYGNIYVASVAMGAKDQHTVKAFLDAESYPGPSLILAYSHCIAHGIDMNHGLTQQKLAVDSGYWPLYRFDPRLTEQGENPFQLDSAPATIPLTDYIYSETRYKVLQRSRPEEAAVLLTLAKSDAEKRLSFYTELAAGSESSKG